MSNPIPSITSILEVPNSAATSRLFIRQGQDGVIVGMYFLPLYLFPVLLSCSRGEHGRG